MIINCLDVNQFACKIDALIQMCMLIEGLLSVKLIEPVSEKKLFICSYQLLLI